MTATLDALLVSLGDHVATEMGCNPEVIDKGDALDVDDLPISARRWHRAAEVVAVVADLKGSTDLGINKHAASTAAIYEAATGGLTRVLDAFGADYVAIQGDGAVGLFWGEKRLERAICSGVTVKTFSEKILVEEIQRKWPEVDTGFKVGIAASSVLVKRVGVPRTSHQEPVWAGKAVNYATKCAQQASVGELLVTGTIWDFAEGNDYLAVSCPCGAGPSGSIWQNITIEKIHDGDGERVGRKLTSRWCDVHGPEYCAAVLAGLSERDDARAAVAAVVKAQREDSLLVAQRKRREASLNVRRGLALSRRK